MTPEPGSPPGRASTPSSPPAGESHQASPGENNGAAVSEGAGAMELAQIAISATDLRRTQRWYRDVLGLEPAGGTNLFGRPLSTVVQGVPRAASTCWWLLDQQDLFQLELFEFRSPLVRSLP